MAKNYNDYGYEDDNGSGLFKKILIILMVVVSIIIIIFLLRGCGKNGDGKNKNTYDYEKAILNAGKNYFISNTDKYPVNKGECTSVDLKTLIDKGLVDKKIFDGCDNSNTYLRVCLLPNGTKHFTPWITCPNKNSENEYKASTEGTIDDVISNQSYIDFKFYPEIINPNNANLGEEVTLWKDEIEDENYKVVAETTYYRYRDNLCKWNVTTKKYFTSKGDNTNVKNVNEYYTVSPNSNYKLYDSKTTEAYKWYITNSEKVYYTDSKGVKKLSPQAVDDYIHNEDGYLVRYYRTRTAVENNLTPTLFYICGSENNKDTKYVKYQPTKCGSGSDDKYIYQLGTVYSCASSKASGDSVVSNIVDNAKSKCYTFGSWSSWSATTKCDITKNTCDYEDVMLYYWYKYKESGNRKYYPSGSSTAAGEKVYYTEAPVNGAVKDTSTKATAYKWYKQSTQTTSEYTAVAPSGYASASKTNDCKFSNWSEWSTKNPKTNDNRERSIETKVQMKIRPILNVGDDGWLPLGENTRYMTLEEMINLFNNNDYKFESLDDINKDGTVRYQLKMYIRNKKETK